PSLEILRRQVEAQKTQLNEAQERMDRLRFELGAIETANGDRPETAAPETVGMFERGRVEVEIRLVNFESLLNKLKTIPRDRLANSIPTLSYPDSRLTELLGQFDAAEAQKAQLTQEFGEEHPKVLGATSTIKTLHRQIENRVDGVMKQIETEVERN